MTAIGDLVISTVAEVLRQVGPLIRSHHRLHADAGDVVAHKGGGHLEYELDEIANDIVLRELQAANVKAKLFSEEGGWRNIGGADGHHVVTCDPYCNTSLTMRGFREAAIALLFATPGGELAAAAVGDFQTDRIYYADGTQALVIGDVSTPDILATPMKTSATTNLDDAFIVCSALKKDRRRSPATAAIFSRAGTFHGVDGAIMIGRLAAGDIDAYVDPFKGQPLYEVPCCELIVRAGGVVTDVAGIPFSLRDVLSSMKDEPSSRYRLVAASTPELHQQLLELVQHASTE